MASNKHYLINWGKFLPHLKTTFTANTVYAKVALCHVKLLKIKYRKGEKAKITRRILK